MEDNSDDLLDQWLNLNEGEETEPQSTIPKAEKSDFYPLSSAQERLWLIYQKMPQSPVYNYAEIWTFDSGSFDASIFRQALDKLVERHQILRSNYVIHAEQPRMVFRRESSFSWTVSEDIKNVEEGRKWLKEQASLPFRLETDPLIRVAHYQSTEGKDYLGVTFHHCIIDAWSLGLLKADFAKYYTAIQANTDLEIDRNTLQYVDYSSWQKTKIKEEPSPSESLASTTSFLALPFDYSRPANPSYHGQILRFSLLKELSPKVAQLLKSLQTTDFNLFLAVFRMVLAKYAKSKEVAVGIPVLNRAEEELKSLVGYFVDTQVIHGPIQEEQTFAELLDAVKKEVLDAITGNKPSYEQQVIQSGEHQDQSINPLFQVMFVGHAPSENVFASNGIDIAVETLDLDVAKFDLTLHHFGLEEGAYQIGLEISSDLFSPVFAERFCGHFTQLLTEICANPELPLTSYSLISAQERKQLKRGLNPNFKPTAEGNVLETILTNLAKKVNETAVVCGEERLTYGQLDHKSKVLARELEQIGADPNQPIGIYLHRSVDFLVSLLAILRYGGYYLPLDPEYPEQRIKQYISDSGAQVVLSQGELLAQKEFLKEKVTILEIDSIEFSHTNGNQLDKEYTIGDFAYLIFTSGSTNTPKGVRVSHANLQASTQARIGYYQDPAKSFLLVSSFSFDSSVAGIFWSLSTGGKLVITQDKETLDAAALAQVIKREKVTHTLMLPSLYQTLLEGEALPSLEKVIVAGEECPGELAHQHAEKHPRAQLFNEYGPTEGTVWCTVQELKRDDSFAKVPIGLPTANTLAYILDENHELQPTGLSGELCIAGPSVVDGYLDSAETKKKFVKNPYSAHPDRLYKTGDLVRLQENGLLEFLGRIDNQVKIRGHRIELNEIQELAKSFSGLRQAVALLIEKGGKQLALGYTSSAPLDQDQLIGYLQQHLPKYMVPDYLLEVPEFPFLPNGKVDLTALAAQIQAKPQELNTTLDKAPSTYLERQVAHIWADVLGLEEVPVNRDFNELGGNSLQSIRVIARCRDMGIKVTPAQFLRYSTVETLVSSLHHEEYERPANLLELAILRTWEKHLSQKLIGVKDSFEKNGGTSFEWKRVEEDLKHVYVFTQEPSNTDSIRDIASKIKTQATSEKESLRRVIPIKTSGSKAPVFCIHSEFYYETVYSQLTRHLPAEYPVYGVLSVSPELIKESVPENIQAIASLCLQEIQRIQPPKEGGEASCRILSYSIGNVVAFEIAKQLLAQGQKVKLVMIDPPLFFDKSRAFGKGGYKKLFTYLDYWKKPGELIDKVRKKVKKNNNAPALIKDTGLLQKYILDYKTEKIACDTLVITTPREFKHTYGWEPLVNIVDTEEILGPHLKLMREPYTGQMNRAIARNLKRWDLEEGDHES